MKSLSCGSTKKTSNAEPVFASFRLRSFRRDKPARQAPKVQCRVQMGILFLDKTDVAAALDPALLYFGDIVVAQTQAHVLLDIVC